ncbi:porphobilinogen deaminase [Podospora bellae-mahoneyi]|uniref:Porphobilinogen deaminase n=1 Tax=Podospora bellae-mahoneyi TaxID=2093777 RepID=A0ABR0FSL8_9PEZI|nr:porphobilinogen deaminase [Podospora bellae-mahoneyi]
MAHHCHTPIHRHPTNAWQAGLCEPGKGGLCPRSCFIGFDQFGRNNYRLNRAAHNDDPLDMKKYKGCNEKCWNCCLLCTFTLSIGSGVYVGKQTHHIRKTYGIQGKYSDDIAQGIFCQPCSLIRNELEVKKREELRDRVIMMQQTGPVPIGEGPEGFRALYTMAPVMQGYRAEPRMSASHSHVDEERGENGQREVALFPREQLPEIPNVGSPLDPFARRNEALTPITERDSTEEGGRCRGGENEEGELRFWLQKGRDEKGERFCACESKKGRKGKRGKRGGSTLPGKGHAVCGNCGEKKKVIVLPVEEGLEQATQLVQEATNILAGMDRNSPNRGVLQIQPGEVFVSEPETPARLRRATVTDHGISADVEVPHSNHSSRNHSLSIDIRVPDRRESVQRHSLGQDPKVVQLVIDPRDHLIEADIRVQEIAARAREHSFSLDPNVGVREERPRGHSLREDEIVDVDLEEAAEVERVEGEHGLKEDVKVGDKGLDLKEHGLGGDQRVDSPVHKAREHTISRDSWVPTPTSRAFAHGIHLDEKVPVPELQRLNVEHDLSQDRKVLTPSPGREYQQHDLRADLQVKSPAPSPVKGHEMGHDVRVMESWADQLRVKEHTIGEDERVASPAPGKRRAPEHLLAEDAKVGQRAHQLLEHFLEDDRKTIRGSSRGSNRKENGNGK